MLAPARCGWLSAQQLGMVLLERAQEAGARLLRGQVVGVDVEAGRVSGVRLAGASTSTLTCSAFVNAGGPFAGAVAQQLGLELPVFCELHTKLTFTDHRRVIPRRLPLMIWNDPIRLSWSREEERELRADHELSWLLEELPGGVHFRPEGGEGSQSLLLLWAYDLAPREPDWPPRFDPLYPQVVLRGVARMVPGFEVYLEGGRAPYVDGGYYCKTRDNRPLVGPLGPPGSYVLAALSGYGIMASQGAAELLAAQITGAELPEWGGAFSPRRFSDPAYLERLEGWDAGLGQL
jgi:glycine/D-amino acid oxidase-like deaminating enzyme